MVRPRDDAVVNDPGWMAPWTPKHPIARSGATLLVLCSAAMGFKATTRSVGGADFDEVFGALRAIMHRHRGGLEIKTDVPGHYYLESAKVAPNRKPWFFGAVRKGKRHVSYHLMPVYMFSALRSAGSAELRRRMPGKSCFNFTRVDERLFAELDELTERGYAIFERRELI